MAAAEKGERSCLASIRLLSRHVAAAVFTNAVRYIRCKGEWASKSSHHLAPISHGSLFVSFFFPASLSCVGTKPWPRIKAVRAYVITADESGDQGADCHDVESDHWINGGLGPIANPMSGWV